MRLTEQQFKDLIDRYLNQTASEEERALLDRFFHSYQKEVADAHQLEDNRQLQKEILQSINARIAAGEGYTRPVAARYWLAIAASITFFVVAYFILDRNVWSRQQPEGIVALVEERTSAGEKLSTKLPDGSKVQLNGDSRITYPRTFVDEERTVILEGEAWFEVVKNSKPFVVHTNEVETHVLGTSFNVKNTPGRGVAITLVEGKVNIISADGKSAELKPSQQAVIPFTTSVIEVHDVNTERFVSWKDNILYFERTTLKEAAETLGCWYAVKIAIQNPDLESCVITGKYQNESLENVLSSFQFLLNLTITRPDDKNVILDGTGCK
jgi:ferric-dicitrate binding protein FerR (iron transport regulator)